MFEWCFLEKKLRLLSSPPVSLPFYSFVVNAMALFVHLLQFWNSSRWRILANCRSLSLSLFLSLSLSQLHLLISLFFYSYIVATYSSVLMFTALSISQQCVGKKKKEKERKEKQPAILLHHNHHHGPFHMGERNFIIVPAGTVKAKLMNTESFLLWRVASLQWNC